MKAQPDGHGGFLTEQQRGLRAAGLGVLFAAVLALLGRRR
jgi:hypothetical protein